MGANEKVAGAAIVARGDMAKVLVVEAFDAIAPPVGKHAMRDREAVRPGLLAFPEICSQANPAHTNSSYRFAKNASITAQNHPIRNTMNQYSTLLRIPNVNWT